MPVTSLHDVTDIMETTYCSVEVHAQYCVKNMRYTAKTSNSLCHCNPKYYLFHDTKSDSRSHCPALRYKMFTCVKAPATRYSLNIFQLHFTE